MCICFAWCATYKAGPQTHGEERSLVCRGGTSVAQHPAGSTSTLRRERGFKVGRAVFAMFPWRLGRYPEEGGPHLTAPVLRYRWTIGDDRIDACLLLQEGARGSAQRENGHF